ncbi:MAG: sel1 repeat family protein [Magnetovibrio sp.]|nr:sel1 repeat family protein [Magnetovibrio sp.]
MKRFVLLVLLCCMMVPTYARAGGNYTDALLLVQKGEFAQALKEFKQLAASGHAPSQFSIGLMYHLGRGVPKDTKLAYEWYKKALLQDHLPALNNIGMMYLNGQYVAQNRDIAYQLFKKAGTTHAQAMDNLAQCYQNGWGTVRNIKRAISMYQLAGESGYLLGWFHLGQIYEKGYPSVPRDFEKAVEWYIKAAEKKQQAAIARLKRLKRLPAGLDR